VWGGKRSKGGKKKGNTKGTVGRKRERWCHRKYGRNPKMSGTVRRPNKSHNMITTEKVARAQGNRLVKVTFYKRTNSKEKAKINHMHTLGVKNESRNVGIS